MKNLTYKYVIAFLSISIGFNFIADIQKAYAQIRKINIAVLNFTSQTGSDMIDAMLSVGTAETIMTDLSNVSQISVVERAKIRDINNEILYNLSGLVDEKLAQRAGVQVGADYIIIGGWQKFGTQYRVNARLVKVETGIVLGSIKQTGSDIFQIQDRIVSEILNKLNISPTFGELIKIERKETQSVEAYQEYSKGLQEIDRGKISEGQAHMKKALVYDPSYKNPKKYLYVVGKDELAIGQYSSKSRALANYTIINSVAMGILLPLYVVIDEGSTENLGLAVVVGLSVGAFVGFIYGAINIKKKE